MAICAEWQCHLTTKLLTFSGGFYASTEDVLAPFAAKADAN
jgi:hypothetical protein